MGLAVGAVAFAAAILLVLEDRAVEIILIVGGLIAAGACARVAVSRPAHLRPAPAPDHPVLIFNPKSGGGKAEQFSLATEARARGIEPIELTRGQDLEQIVRDAVARGADGLAMAGGDGSQAIVASIAAELDLPYACVPAGTRNHFALDLGVDRDDVVGALDAFVNGRERQVDLGEVNGRVFVNNVSLGVYAEAVQRSGYRDAKLRTLLDTVPDVLGSSGSGLDLSWTGPDGHEHHSGAVILVSNNRYRLGRAVGSGTRPAIDDGLLGIAIVGAPTGRGEGGRAPQRPVRQWTAPTFEVRADDPFPQGSTARRCSSSRRCGSRSARACCGCASHRSIPAPRRRRSCPRAWPTACARSRGSRPGVNRQTTTNEGDLMDIVEIEQKEKVSRAEVVSRLRKLATMLAKGNDVKFEQGGMSMTVHVPDEVELKVELEVETDERELEIELKW